MLNQGCCGSSQYNLIDRMLQVNAKTLNQKLFIFQFFGQHYILERGSVSPIYPFLAQWLIVGVIHPIFLFLFFSLGHCFKLFSEQRLVFSNAYKPNQFLVLNKVSFFPTCHSSLLLSHYYYYHYYFYYYFSFTHYCPLCYCYCDYYYIIIIIIVIILN